MAPSLSDNTGEHLECLNPVCPFPEPALSAYKDGALVISSHAILNWGMLITPASPSLTCKHPDYGNSIKMILSGKINGSHASG